MAIRKSLLRTTTASILIAVGILPKVAIADSVQLNSEDGEIQISGNIVDFVNGEFVLQTELGRFNIPAYRVECLGTNCPQLDPADADIRIISAPTVATDLVPLALAEFAASIDGAIAFDPTTDDGAMTAYLDATNADGNRGLMAISEDTNAGAFAALAAGEADIVLTTRRASSDELEAIGAAGDPGRLVGREAVVVFAHPDNPVGALSVDQLRDIYTGRVSNWAALGGPDLEIQVFGYERSNPVRSAIETMLFQSDTTQIARNARIVENVETAAVLANEDRAAIAFVPASEQGSARTMSIVASCGISTDVTQFSMETDIYPLSQEVYLYTGTMNDRALAREFEAFLDSDEADYALVRAGAFGVDVIGETMEPLQAWAADRAVSGSRLERRVYGELLDAQAGFARLSLSFHFESSSFELDAASQADIDRLIAHLETLPAGTRIQFVGFTDSYGSFGVNRRMSSDRAEAVMDLVLEAAGPDIGTLSLSAIGFGEIAPIACNSTSAGQDMNRRVEVWVETDAPS